MKKTALLLAAITILLTGCSQPTTAPAATATPATAATSAPATPSPTASPNLEPTPSPTPTPEPTPEPTADPVSLFLGGKADPGLKIARFAIADSKSVYFLLKGEIHRLDKATGKSEKLIKPKAVVWQMFLDAKGTLYYLCYSEHDAKYYLYKLAGKRQVLVTDTIDEVLRADRNSIYYTRYTDRTEIRRVDLASGKTATVAIKGIEDITQYKALHPKPLLLANGKLIDLAAGSSQAIADPDRQNVMVSEDGNTLLVYEYDLAAPALVYDLTSGVRAIIPIPAELAGIHMPFTPDAFLFTGAELQVLYENYLFRVDAATGGLLGKVCLVESHKPVAGSPVPAGSLMSWTVVGGNWYVMTQQPVSYDTSTGDKLIQDIRPELLRFDSTTGQLKSVWSMRSYRTGGSLVLLDAEGGWLWCYLHNSISMSYWTRIPLANIDK